MDLTNYNPRPRSKNKFYPLPHDYPDLTEEGKQLARRAAVSRVATADQFVESWDLFRKLYLQSFDNKQLYPHKLFESPPAHYEWLWKFWKFSKTAIAAPRASAKSTVLGKELILMLLLTQPHTITTLVLPSGPLRQERFDIIMSQLTDNPYILKDFGAMKSPKGSGIWNHEYLKLANGAILQGVTVDGRKRGGRPHFMIMDDPEYDPDKEENDTEFLKKAENLIFNQLLPMLEEDSRFLWIGTMLSRRSALWNVCQSEDPRFQYWDRKVHSQVEEDDSGNVTYFWSDKWGPERVEQLKNEMGEAAWQKEYQNNPVANSARLLSIHEQLGTYRREGPFIQYMDREPDGSCVAIERPWEEFLSELGVVITVDPSISESLRSDHSAVLVTGIDSNTTWWLLDLCLGNWVGNNLVNKVWDMASQWNASIVGVESVGLNTTFVQAMQASYDRHELRNLPRLKLIKYPGRLSKQERIATLSARFARNAIKLPAHLRTQFPWKELWHQIEYFTMDLAMLQRDDAIDSLAMVHFCPGARGGRLSSAGAEKTVWDYMKQGLTNHPETGIPLSQYINPREIPRDVLKHIADSRIRASQAAERKQRERKTSHAAEVLRKNTSKLGQPLLK